MLDKDLIVMVLENVRTCPHCPSCAETAQSALEHMGVREPVEPTPEQERAQAAAITARIRDKAIAAAMRERPACPHSPPGMTPPADPQKCADCSGPPPSTL